MPDVKALEAAVPTLPPAALAEFRQWFAEFDSTTWTQQLEADRNAGKLDRLLAAAEEDHEGPPRRTL